MKIKYLVVISLLLASTSYSQVKDYELGTPNLYNRNYNAGYYDYSDPFSVNFKVSVWGFVRHPGRYNLPQNITLIDLLSYAGGPTDDALLEDLRIYRLREDGTQQMIIFDIDDLWRQETLYDETRDLIQLQAGDVIVVPGEPRLYFKDWFSITISTLGTLISLATFIIVLNQ
jgi:polysaccharide export outer membrane protein